MKDSRTKEQKISDRKQEIAGIILGTYARNNSLRKLPIDDKSLNEIVDYISPFYHTFSCYDYEQIMNALKESIKTAPKEHKKYLRILKDKLQLMLGK
jgi:hypothetical protein